MHFYCFLCFKHRIARILRIFSPALRRFFVSLQFNIEQFNMRPRRTIQNSKIKKPSLSSRTAAALQNKKYFN